MLLPPLLILLALETGPGQRFAADKLSELLSTPEAGIRISDLGGSLWDRLTVGRVVLSDAEGPWLTVEEAVLDWSPLSLLDDKASVSLLQVAKVEMPRPPLPGPETPEPEEPDDGRLIPELPSLPVDIALDRLAVGTVVLGAPLLGVPAQFGIGGAAAWPRGGETRVTLAVEGQAETELSVHADLGWQPESEVLTLDLSVREPAGGLVSRLAALPTLPSIDLTLSGQGTLSDWVGELRLALDGVEAVKGDIALSGAPERRFALTGRIDPSGSLPPELLPEEARPWLAGGADLDVAAVIGEDLVTLQRFSLKAATAAIEASGTLAPESERVDARLSASLAADSPLRALVPEVQLGALSLEADARGALALPSLRLNARVEGVSTAEATLRGLALDLEAEPQGDQVAATLDLRLEGPEVLLPEVPPLPYGSLRVTAAALVSPEAGSAVLQRFRLSGDGLDLTLDGDLDLPAIRGRPQLHLEAVLPELGGIEPMLAGLPLSLTLDSGLALDGLEQPIAANLNATVVGTGGLPDGIGPLLGDGLVLSGGVTYGPDGSIALSEVSLLGPHLAVDLDGTLGSERLAMTWQVALDDLAAAQQLMGGPAAGRLQAGGRFVQEPDGRLEVSADIAGRGLVAAGERIGRLDGKVALAGAPPELSGDISLAAPESGYGPLSLSAQVAPTGKEAFRIAPLKVALGKEVQINGGLTVPAGGLPISGELNGTLAGGRLLANLGVPLQGNGTLSVSLTGQGSQQNARLALNLAPGQLADIPHQGISLQAEARDATGKLQLQGSLTGSKLRVAPSKVETLEVTFQGSPEHLAVTLESEGDFKGPTRLSLAGDIRQAGERTTVTLTRFAGQLAGLPMEQTKETRVTIGPAGPEQASLGLQFAGADFTLDAKLTGSAKRVDLELSRFDLARLKPLMGGDVPQGTIAASLALTGNRRAQGTIRVTGKGISVQEEGLPLNPPLDLTLDGTLGQQGLSLDGRIVGSFEQPLTLQAQVPLQVSLAEPGASLDEDGPISGRIAWHGELGPLVDLLPVGEQRVTGEGTIDLRLDGSVADPQVAGTVTIRNGRYENLMAATVVEDLTMTLEGNNQRLEIRELSGTDGQKGRLKVTGAFDLAAEPAPSLQAKLAMTDFAVARRSDLYARMDAEVSVDGNLADGLDVKGTITNDEIRANVQPDLPASVPTLEVELVRDGKPVNPRKAEDEEASPALPIRLDITIDLPRRVFVAGAGLDSEWGGKLFVTGTANKPFITGKIEPLRGLFSFFGKQFDLQEGSVAFDGSANIDPTLDLSALYDGDDFTATIRVSGSASEPKLSMSSDPDMPQDEILSQVLFGRGTGQISPIEALQLAEAASILSGVTGQKRSTVDVLRDTIGVDVLRVEAGEGDNDAVATVGQYISEDIFVGVRQGTTPGSTQATVEVDLLPGVKLEGRAGADAESDNGAMLRWEWNY